MSETNKTILELTSEVNELKRIVNNHITGVSNYHEPAAPFSSGVLDDEGYIELQMATGFMKKMISSTDNPVDPLNLPPGLYSIANAINNPSGDDAIIYYKVFQDGNTFADGSLKRKMILAVRSWDGKAWLRTIYTDGTPGSGTKGWIDLGLNKTKEIMMESSTGSMLTDKQEYRLGFLPKLKSVTFNWGRSDRGWHQTSYDLSAIEFDQYYYVPLVDDMFENRVFAKEIKFIKKDNGEVLVVGSNGNADTNAGGKWTLRKIVSHNEN